MKKDNLLYVHFSNHWMIKGSSDGAGSAGKRQFLENLTSNTVLVQHQQHGFSFVPASTVECCEKYKSFKFQIPQPDSERRHSPDFRTVFGIMIGPFSSCEIGKT